MITHTINDNIVVHEYPEQIFIIKNLISQTYCTKMVNIMKQINFDNRIQYKNKNNVIGEELPLFKLNNLYNSQLKPDDRNVLRDLTIIFYSIYIRSIVYVIHTINSNIFNNMIPRISTILVRKIDGPTRIHVDKALMQGEVRTLSCVVAYNDDYKDGKFYFPNQNIELKLEAGDILLFPPYWTHPHYTDSPVENVRYTSTFWFNDPNSLGTSVF